MNTKEEYDLLPQEAKDIVDTFDENGDAYFECGRIINKLKTIGWTADFDLSGTLYDFKKISNKDTISGIVDKGINDIFGEAHELYQTESGDISPEQFAKLEKLKEELSELVHQHIKENF